MRAARRCKASCAVLGGRWGGALGGACGIVKSDVAERADWFEPILTGAAPRSKRGGTRIVTVADAKADPVR